MNPIDIDWNDVIKKEARGINNEDFGEIQDIQGNYILVQKGIIIKQIHQDSQSNPVYFRPCRINAF